MANYLRDQRRYCSISGPVNANDGYNYYCDQSSHDSQRSRSRLGGNEVMTWYKDNKERESKKQKAYKATPEFKKMRKEYDKKNHDHQLELKRQWKINNPEKLKAQKSKDNKKYRLKNKHNPIYIEKEKLRHARYSKENPDKMLKNHINSLKKLGLTLNMTHFKIGMALKSWSQSVRKEKPFCWCGEKADVTHHLFEKQYYPQLMLNINNGMPLCTRHHDEVHGRKLMEIVTDE